MEIYELKAYGHQLPSLQLSNRLVCDLELLATGAFSPLDRFMGQQDYQRVLDEMRLSSGHLFPIPLTLPIDDVNDIRVGQHNNDRATARLLAHRSCAFCASCASLWLS